MNQEVIEPFPTAKANIEGIEILGFPNAKSLIHRMVHEIKQNKEKLPIFYPLEVSGANIAEENPQFKKLLQEGNLVYADGAGIVLASKMLKQPLPARMTAADWIFDLLEIFAENNLSIFIIAGEPGVADRALELFNKKVPNHKVVGVHHGYIHNDKNLENQVIEKINALAPDLLVVGFGRPLQEFWIDRNKNNLNVKGIIPLGAVLDYHTGVVPRCPDWMGKNGLEWLFRFSVEPKRLFKRYIHGNPWFLWRISLETTKRFFRKSQ